MDLEVQVAAHVDKVFAITKSVADHFIEKGISKDKISGGINILDILAQETSITPSKGEARKLVQSNGIALNMEKYADVNGMINIDHLIHGNWLVVRKGKKEYSLIRVV